MEREIQFSYGDRVEVFRGFWKGLRGSVINIADDKIFYLVKGTIYNPVDKTVMLIEQFISKHDLNKY